ncbi:MAG: metallophosphoesterase [Candidatus Eremiobacteraeota bacterium]|nr:metallophosphoesterase [Candidatus Eremiobacteraeota bacterium]
MAPGAAPCAAADAQPPRGEQVWLAVSDIHLDVLDRSRRPSAYGRDTNVALFQSALSHMRRVAPNATAVLISGDFLAHGLGRHAALERKTPEEVALRTMRWIANGFARAFPRAQFAIALGNNDVPCGDYRSANGSAYLRSVARTWSPLVDRGGAAPEFEASFARAGHYVAALPVPGLRLVVLDTIPLSYRYAGDCASSSVQPGDQELAWMTTTLDGTPPGSRNVVMMHVPPGFDAFSTNYTDGLLAWPFFKRQYAARFVAALANERHRVAYALAGHTHRFDFRMAGDVPIVVLGSLSPVYGNDTTFYVLRIAADGSLRDIEMYSFDQRLQGWLPAHSFDRSWGLGLDGASLRRLHTTLANVPAARVHWQYQAEGWPSDLVEDPGAWGGRRWRVSWCAQTFLIQGFAGCAGIEHRIQLLAGGVALIAAAIMFLLALFLRRRA